MRTVRAVLVMWLVAALMVIGVMAAAAFGSGLKAQQAMPTPICDTAMGARQAWLTSTISTRMKGDTVQVSIRCVWVAK